MAKTNNSKRRRQAVYVTKIDIEESGIVIPEHIKKLKNPRKHFRLEEYNSKLNILKNDLNNLQHALENAKQSTTPIPVLAYDNLLIFNYYSAVIQYFVVLDVMINSILTQHQIEQNVNFDEVKYFSKIDQGITEFLPQQSRSKEFDKKYSRIKHFRTLRNQFSHYSYGTFMLEAKEESFESFLNNLDGIEFTTPGGFHGYLDTKPGMSLPYNFTSGEFVHTLFEEGTEFYKELLKIFFPDPKD